MELNLLLVIVGSKSVTCMRGIRVTDLLPKLAAMTMKLCNCSKEFSFSAKKMGTKFVTYVRRGEGITFTSQKVQDLLRESVAQI